MIPMTKKELRQRPEYRHPPGNVRAEDMQALFGNTIMMANLGRQYAEKPFLKVIFIGRDGRYLYCTRGRNGEYFFSDHIWAPVKHKHDGQHWPVLDPNINEGKLRGLSPLYDSATGRTIWYSRGDRDKSWTDWNVGHVQARLPRAVYTLCPDFPPASELGVGINEAQTAITFDEVIAQDPGRRILRPDLVTPNPVEPAP